MWEHVFLSICRGVTLCGVVGRLCVFQASSLIGWLSLSPGASRGVLVMEDNSVALTAVRRHQGRPALRSITVLSKV